MQCVAFNLVLWYVFPLSTCYTTSWDQHITGVKSSTSSFKHSLCHIYCLFTKTWLCMCSVTIVVRKNMQMTMCLNFHMLCGTNWSIVLPFKCPVSRTSKVNKSHSRQTTNGLRYYVRCQVYFILTFPCRQVFTSVIELAHGSEIT